MEDTARPDPFRGLERALPWCAALLGLFAFLSNTGATLAFLAGAAILLARFARVGGAALGRLPGLHAPLALYAASFLASALAGANPGASLARATELRRLLIPFLVASSLAGRADRRRLVLFALAGACLSSACTFYQWRCGGTYTSLHETHAYAPYELLRPSGFSSSCNDCGLLLMQALGLALAPVAFGELSPRARLVGAAASALIGLGMLRTLCRAAQVGALAGFAALGLAVQPKRAAALAVLLAALFCCLPGTLRQRSNFESLDPAVPSNAFRLRMLSESLAMSRRAFPWGVGRRNFTALQTSMFPADEPAPHAHNNYLNLLIEQGVGGLVALVWFQAALFLHLARRLRERPDPELLGLAHALIAFAVAGLFHFDWGDTLPVTLMWVLVGAAYATVSAPERAAAAA